MAEGQDIAWRRLWGLSAYRLFIAAALALLVRWPWGEPVLQVGDDSAMLRRLSLLAGLVSLLYLAALTLRLPRDPRHHAFGQVVLDTLVVLLLIQYGGGLAGPLNILLFLLLLSTASLLRGHSAFIFVWILMGLLLAQALLFPPSGPHFLLGQGLVYALALIAVAVLADSLMSHVTRSESLAAARGTELTSLNALNREIIQHMDVGVMVLDRWQRVVLSNPIARALSGYVHWADAPLPVDLVSPQIFSALPDCRADRDGPPLLIGGAEGGEGYLVQMRCIPLGEGGYRLLLLTDLSQVRERERQAQLAALGRLSANIAHEVRNPLSAIRHAAELLKERQYNTLSLRLCTILEREAARINEIVESVLELGSPRPAHPESVDVAVWLPATLEQLRQDPQMAELKITLQAGEPDLRVWVDPAHLRQILWNLLHNARRHGRGPDGVARVELGVHASGTHTVELELRDFGLGIGADLADRIFEPFFTTDSRGTGLGLSMVRELLRLNGGSISCRNHPLGGAVFRVVLPSADDLSEARTA